MATAISSKEATASISFVHRRGLQPSLRPLLCSELQVKNVIYVVVSGVFTNCEHMLLLLQTILYLMGPGMLAPAGSLEV